LQVRESDKLVVAETVGLIRRQLCPSAGRHQRQARADSQQQQNRAWRNFQRLSWLLETRHFPTPYFSTNRV
jgi:hypothetical protein